MTDNEMINCLNDTDGKEHIGIYCTDKNGNFTTVVKLTDIVDLVNRKNAEIERFHKLQKPTETSGFKIKNGKVVFYTNILNGYRHEYKDLEEVVKELNLMLQSCYKCDDVVSHYKGNLNKAKIEAIREFAERLKSVSHPYADTQMVFKLQIDNHLKEMVGDE